MRKTAATFFALVIITFFSCTQAFAQQTLPDYTKWNKTATATIPAVHNGTDVNLVGEFYENLDVDNLYSSSVMIFYDEQRRPWIALYTRVILYKDGNKLVPAGTEYYLFENNSNKWSFVKDFSQSKNLSKETDDFLKSRYGLEFK